MKERIRNEWDELAPEQQLTLIKNAFALAGGLEGGAIVWTEKDGFEAISYDPNRFFKDGVYVVFDVEPNWVANSSWEYKDILGKEPPRDTEDIDEWADKEAREQGYMEFRDALCEIFSMDVLNDGVVEKNIEDLID